MDLPITVLDHLAGYFDQAGLLPANAREHLLEMSRDQFVFRDQLAMADSIHLHIKVAGVDQVPHDSITRKGGQPQNAKEGYIKYAFPDGLNFIFSSIPVAEEEVWGVAPSMYPYLDHIGIDIRDEGEEGLSCFNKIPALAAEKGWACKKQGGNGKKVHCCHTQVNEKYWVYSGGTCWEFASGKLITGNGSGCDLRPAHPALTGPVAQKPACCDSLTSVPEQTILDIAVHRVVAIRCKIRNSKGEVLEDTTGGPAVHYLHGAAGISPLLENRLAGLKPGDKKTIFLSREEDPGADDDFYVEVMVDEVRMATEEELRKGKPLKTPNEDCGPGCHC